MRVVQVAAQRYTVAAAQARQLSSLVEHWHVPARELLEEFRLTTEELERPGARLPASTMVAIIERAQALTGEQALGCHLGEQKHVSMYGVVGFAAMSASTLGESMAITARFAPVVSSAFDIRLRVEGNRASMIFDELTDLGAAREVELIDRLVGIPRVANALAGGRLDMEIDFAIPEPAYWSRYAHLSPGARFDQPVTQLVLDAAALDLPMRTPDPASVRFASAQCEQGLLDLGLRGSLEERVVHHMTRSEGFASLEGVAAALSASPRTLKRRLASLGTTFSNLRDRERRHRALLLVRSPLRSLDDIAYRLGYSATPAFIRAFRSWTGQTPAAYRKMRAVK